MKCLHISRWAEKDGFDCKCFVQLSDKKNYTKIVEKCEGLSWGNTKSLNTLKANMLNILLLVNLNIIFLFVSHTDQLSFGSSIKLST